MTSSVTRPEQLGAGLSSALNPILTGLAALYLALLVNHTILQPNLKLTPLVLLGSATTLVLFSMRWALGHWELPEGWAESASSALAGIVLLHCVLHLYLLSNFLETTNLGLLGAGITCFFLPPRRLALVLVCTLGIWVLLAAVTVPSTAWLYFAFGLFAAAGLRVHTECHNAQVTGALARACEEIAKRTEAEAALRVSEERFALAARASNDGLWDWDLPSETVYYSNRWKSLAGLAEHEIDKPGDWFHRVHPDDIAGLRRRILAHLGGASPLMEAEYRLLHADGRYRWMLSRGVAVLDQNGKPHRLVGSQTDISEKKKIEAKLTRMAYYDDLTRLPNRTLFQDRVDEALNLSRRSPNFSFAVLFLDLDGFRSVNESWGRTVGDWVLQNVAARIKTVDAGPDRAARLGADQFALVVEEVQTPAGALNIAESVREKLSEPFVMEDGKKLFLTVSVGAAWGRGGKQAQDLTLNAEAAMQQAKRKGGNRCELYSPRSRLASLDRLRLQDDFHSALEQQQFRLLYQPIVSLCNGRILGLEAIVNWAHPALGVLTGDQFLPLVQETELATKLGIWTLNQACAKMKEWRRNFPESPLFSVSVNVFKRQFVHLDLGEQTIRALHRSELPAEALRLEFTDEVYQEGQEDAVLGQLWDLQEGGVQCCLDHFGTRRSPLNSLRRFPYAAVKVDRSLTCLPASTENRRVVQAAVRLIADLSMEAILDGLDTQAQAEDYGDLCEYGEGNWFGAPMDEDKVEELLLKPAEA